jgi:hypothetical protein
MKGTKRRCRGIMAPVLLAVSLLALAACGSDSGSGGDKGGGAGFNSSAPPTGTYQSKLGPEQTFFLNFLGNNDIEVTMRDGGRDESYRTSFAMSGDSIIVNIPEAERQEGLESMTLKRNGETLEWTIEGMTIAFVKP